MQLLPGSRYEEETTKGFSFRDGRISIQTPFVYTHVRSTLYYHLVSQVVFLNQYKWPCITRCFTDECIPIHVIKDTMLQKMATDTLDEEYGRVRIIIASSLI